MERTTESNDDILRYSAFPSRLHTICTRRAGAGREGKMNGKEAFETASKADGMRRGAELARFEELFDLAVDAENIKFAMRAAEDMALLAVEYEGKNGDMDLLEQFGYFDAMQRLMSYVARDMQELQDNLYEAAGEERPGFMDQLGREGGAA